MSIWYKQAFSAWLTVTVKGTSDSTMLRGLICQVRKASDPDTAVGTLNVMENDQNWQVLSGTGCEATAVTHTSRNDKAMAQFYWTPPGDMGNVKVM